MREKKSETATVISILVLLCITMSLLSWYGASGRAYAKPGKIITITAPSLAYNVWAENNVRGRVLFLFDRKLNAEPDEESQTENNYVFMAIRKSIVRKVYHIVPDSSWSEVERVLSGFKHFSRKNDIFKSNIDGAPIDVMRLRDIKPLNERVLVNINGNNFDDTSMRIIADVLKDNIIRGDIITISGNISDTNLRGIEAYEKIR